MPFTQEEIDSAPTINEWRQDPDFKKMAPAEQRQFIQRYGMEVERKRTINQGKSGEARSLQAQAIMHGGAVPDRTVAPPKPAVIPGRYGNALADAYNNSLMGKISQTVNSGQPAFQSQPPKSFTGKLASAAGSLALDAPAYVVAGTLGLPAKAMQAVSKAGKAAPMLRAAIEGAKTYGLVGTARDAMTPPAPGETKTIGKTLQAGARDAAMGAATLGAGEAVGSAAANAIARTANKGAINLLGKAPTLAQKAAPAVARNMAETGVQSIDEVMRNGLPVNDQGEVDYGALGAGFARNVLLSGLMEGTQVGKRAVFDRMRKGKIGAPASAATAEGDALVDGLTQQKPQPGSEATNWNELPAFQKDAGNGRMMGQQEAMNKGYDAAGPDFFMKTEPEKPNGLGVGKRANGQRSGITPDNTPAIEPTAIYANEADAQAALLAERALPPGQAEASFKQNFYAANRPALPEPENVIPMGGKPAKKTRQAPAKKTRQAPAKKGPEFHPDVLDELAGRMDAHQKQINFIDQALNDPSLNPAKRQGYQSTRAKLAGEWNGMFSVFRAASEGRTSETARSGVNPEPSGQMELPLQLTNEQGRPTNPTEGAVPMVAQPQAMQQQMAKVPPRHPKENHRAQVDAAAGPLPAAPTPGLADSSSTTGGAGPNPDDSTGAAPNQLHAGVNPFGAEAERALYDAAGGVTPFGEWVPGVKAAEAAQKRIQSETSSPLVNKVLNGLVQDWNMPEAHKTNKRSAEQASEAVRQFAKETDAVLYRVQPDQREQITRILEGEAPADPTLAHIVDPIRTKLETLSDDLVGYGALSPEARERYRGEWLNRSYMEHEAPGSEGFKFLGKAFSDTKKFAAGVLKGRGKFIPISGDRAQRLLQTQHVDMANGNQVYQLQDGHKYELRMVGNKFTLWRDWTPQERQEFGQVMDARYNVLKSLDQMAQNIETGKLFSDTAADSNLAIPGDQPQPDGWVHLDNRKIPRSGTPVYGALADHWVHPGVARDIKAIVTMRSPSVWNSVMSTWKTNKTARSVRTHVYNVGSNFLLSELHGVDMTTDLPQAAKGLIGKGDAPTKQLLKEAQEDGVFGRTNLDGLRRAMLGASPVTGDVAPDANMKQRGQAAMAQFLRSMQMGSTKPLEYVKGTANLVKWLDSEAIRAYQGEDEIFRFAMYLNRRKMGMERGRAAKEAIDGFVDTSNVNAPVVNALARYTHPFIKWPYKAFPVMASAVAKRPLRAAKIAALMMGFNAISSRMAGGDEDAERNAMDETMPGIHLRLPYRDSYDQQRYLDVTKFVPGQQFTELNSKGALPLPAALAPGGPAATLAELALNQSGFTGKDIRDTRKPWQRQVGEVASYVAQAALPDIPGLPGSYSTSKIAAAMQGRPDSGGRLNPVPEAVLSTLGIKTNPVDVRQLTEKRVGIAKGKIAGYTQVIGQYKNLARRKQMPVEQARALIDEQVQLIIAEQQALRSYLEKVRQPMPTP